MAQKIKRNQNEITILMVNISFILDTHIYNMESTDIWVEEYSTNSILKNLYKQVDANGWDTGVLNETMDFRSNQEVDILQVEYAMVEVNGINKPVITTKGWDVQVQRDYWSTDWVPLNRVKNITL